MSDVKRMHLGTVIELLIYFWVEANDDKTINKPVSWSLYQVWKIMDRKEQPRKTEQCEVNNE